MESLTGRKMKVLAVFGFLVVVEASYRGYYKDEGCATPLLEAKINDGQLKRKFSSNTVTFAINTCTKLEPAFEVTDTMGSVSVKKKYSYTWGLQCSEYGHGAFTLMGSKNKDCITTDKTGSEDDDYAEFEEMAVSSVCTLYNPTYETTKSDPIYMYVRCDPANGSVAGIILGSIALVLSLAGIGLAAMAMSKKGKNPPPAKPAAPAGEGAAQGSTTAAAAVGAATEA